MKLGRRFVVRRKLGEGTFGRVLECTDLRHGGHVAVKVVRDVSHYTTSARIEADILADIRNADPEHHSNCVVLVDRYLYDARRRRSCTSMSAPRRRRKRRCRGGSRSENRASSKYTSTHEYTDGKPCVSSKPSLDTRQPDGPRRASRTVERDEEDDFAEGVHMCLASEKLGLSLYAFLIQNQYRGFFVADIQKIAYETLKALAFLRELKLTHTDLKPENVLFVHDGMERVPFPRSRYSSRFWDGNCNDSELERSSTPSCVRDCCAHHYDPVAVAGGVTTFRNPAGKADYSSFSSHTWEKCGSSCVNTRRRSVTMTKRPLDCHVKLIDFGGATYESDEHSTIINTRQYRAPEVILQTGWSMPSDMWSLGCILVELYTGVLLFRTHEHLEHLAMIEKIVAPFPQSVLKAASRSPAARYLAPRSSLDEEFRLNWPKGASSKRSVEKVARCHLLEDMFLPCHQLFAEFVRFILVPDPELRPTPMKALEHPFLRAVLPEG